MGAVTAAKKNLPANWEKEMAEDAKKGRAREKNVGVSLWVKTQGGTLRVFDTPMPGNKVQGVILHASFENAWYGEDDFDPDNPKSPLCYARGEVEEELAPHADAEKPQSKDCASCAKNKFGSADKGRGKACKNQRVISFFHADSLKSKSGLADAQVAKARIPPTALPSWASMVRKMEELTGKPVYGHVTEMSIVPGKRGGHTWTFDAQKEVEKKHLGEVFLLSRAAQKEHAESPPYPKDDAGAAKSGKSAAKKKRKF